MMHTKSFSILLRSKDLFYQFIFDMYAEAERLRYISLNEKSLRVEESFEAIMNEGNALQTLVGWLYEVYGLKSLRGYAFRN